MRDLPRAGQSSAAADGPVESSMNGVNRILSAIDAGDPLASERLLPAVCDELRKLAASRLAREEPGPTLQATALVHEAYLRLVGPDGSRKCDNRGHFFAAAAYIGPRPESTIPRAGRPGGPGRLRAGGREGP